MREHARYGHEESHQRVVQRTEPCKRTLSQQEVGGSAGGSATVPVLHHPQREGGVDPFDFDYEKEYAELHASLLPAVQGMVEEQADKFHDKDISGVTWSALEQATGKSRGWIEGYLQWVYRTHHQPTFQVTNTAPKGVLERNGDERYDGTQTVDASGHIEYKGTFHGSHFPGAKYRNDLDVKLNSTIKNEYLVELDQELPDVPRGVKLLMTAMTKMEGFSKDSKSYATHNPGNIGNKDNGSKKQLDDLGDGIRLQYEYLRKIAAGENPRYPLGKEVDLAPYYSKEIAEHPSYGKSPYVPGYEFVYTGQLDQFIKIYSTGARAGNNYLNTIVSYFKQNGVDITPETTLAEIFAIQ